MRRDGDAMDNLAPSIACGMVSVHGKSILVFARHLRFGKGKAESHRSGAPLLSVKLTAKAPANGGLEDDCFPFGAWHNLAAVCFRECIPLFLGRLFGLGKLRCYFEIEQLRPKNPQMFPNL